MTIERQEHKEILDAVNEVRLDVREIFTKIDSIERYISTNENEIKDLEKRIMQLENKTAPVLWFFGAAGFAILAGLWNIFID